MTRKVARIKIEQGECNREAIMMAIKASSQEPILDKIRAEIDSLEWWCNGEDYFVNRKAVKCILDKYKAETEK